MACIAASLNTASSANAFCNASLAFFFSPSSPLPTPRNTSSLNLLTILRNECNQFTLFTKGHRRSNLAFACKSLSYTSSSYSSVFIVSKGSRLYLLQLIVLFLLPSPPSPRPCEMLSCTFFQATPNTMRLMTSFENFAQSSRVFLSAFSSASSASSSSSSSDDDADELSESLPSSLLIIHTLPGTATNSFPGRRSPSFSLLFSFFSLLLLLLFS